MVFHLISHLIHLKSGQISWSVCVLIWTCVLLKAKQSAVWDLVQFGPAQLILQCRSWVLNQASPNCEYTGEQLCATSITTGILAAHSKSTGLERTLAKTNNFK